MSRRVIWCVIAQKLLQKSGYFAVHCHLADPRCLSLTKQHGSSDDDDDEGIESREIKMYTNDKGLNNRAAMKSILLLEDGESSAKHGSRAAKLLILYY